LNHSADECFFFDPSDRQSVIDLLTHDDVGTLLSK
jgi:hypothetical protein